MLFSLYPWIRSSRILLSCLPASFSITRTPSSSYWMLCCYLTFYWAWLIEWLKHRSLVHVKQTACTLLLQPLLSHLLRFDFIVKFYLLFACLNFISLQSNKAIMVPVAYELLDCSAYSSDLVLFDNDFELSVISIICYHRYGDSFHLSIDPNENTLLLIFCGLFLKYLLYLWKRFCQNAILVLFFYPCRVQVGFTLSTLNKQCFYILFIQDCQWDFLLLLPFWFWQDDS
jgi:hypothetical protein